MADRRGGRLAPERAAATHEPGSEAQDGIEHQQLRQWLEYVRNGPPGTFHFWRPVLGVALALVVAFIGLAGLDLLE